MRMIHKAPAIIALLCMIIILVIGFGPIATNASGPSAEIKFFQAGIEKSSVTVEDNFDAVVQLTDIPAFSVVSLPVRFDPSKVQVVSYNTTSGYGAILESGVKTALNNANGMGKGQIFDTATMGNDGETPLYWAGAVTVNATYPSVDNINGLIKVSGTNSAPKAISGTQTAFTIRFKAIAAGDPGIRFAVASDGTNKYDQTCPTGAVFGTTGGAAVPVAQPAPASFNIIPGQQPQTSTPTVTGNIKAGDTSIAGTAEANAIVTVKKGSTTIGSANASAAGTYTVTLNAGVTLAVNDVLAITARAEGKTESEVFNVTVGPATSTPFTVNTTFTIDGQSAASLAGKGGGILDAVSSMTNNGTASKNALLIVALYNGSTFINVSYISKTLAPGASETFHAGFKLPSNVTGHSVKAMVWEGTDLSLGSNQNPLSPVVSLP